uniref:Fe2OG dioxygenase domain-containing protein n=1 Tax=Chromera velia CCMP2878 TaxID=1169474 RepID=A0A0G4GKQ9_9ALVE|eukprot:Cvel_22332.t1-p1 / transcript=Cvel_22332.t1 / gene=Cvel_22332 / organism=Chromera_velia_CCMP2878 / gene_product=Ectoine hydroxylase, putative / transcript_product=Ectoine hydroxylase, putative / location=Cvel_scaffold2185:9092-9988(+) / protein_length=299 / sequence_SO=supercontig / SO=protein_coding / is_pseudo=false
MAENPLKAGGRQLSADEIAAYHRDGMLVVRNFFSKEEEAVVVRATNDIQNFPEEKGKQMIYFETTPSGERRLCRTENYIPYHSELKALFEGKLVDAVADLLGEPAVLFKEKINYKFPGAKGFGAHQDSPAYKEFPQKTILTAMVSADPSTIENGCLEMVRGKHTEGIVAQNDDGTISTSLCETYKWESLLLGPADVAFFSADTPHRSGPNASQGSRRAHFLTFNPASEGQHRDGYYAEKRKKFPPPVEMEPGKDYSEGAKIYNLANPISVNRPDSGADAARPGVAAAATSNSLAAVSAS